MPCFDENLFTCQCDKEKKKAQGFQILHFQWPFLSDIMAVKGLMKRGWSMNQTMMAVSLCAPYPFTSHAHTTLMHATNVVKQTRSNKMTTRKEKEKKRLMETDKNSAGGLGVLVDVQIQHSTENR